MSEIKRYKLDAAFAELKSFDVCAKGDDFIEVTMWYNGEGFDVHLSSHSNQSFRLTWGQYKALKKLVKELDND
jgi:hypothetical protein